MKRKHLIFSILLLMIVSYITPVNACPFTFNDYMKTGEEHSYIVGDYVFDLSMGFSPSLEDFAIAARTIPNNQDEYVYEITYVPELGLYNQLEIFSKKSSNKSSDWPNFFDTTYNYRTNINISKPDYDEFTCQTNNIKINYSLLNTKGEEEYKTEANRIIDIQSTTELGSAKYCLTAENKCDPNSMLDVSGKSSTVSVNYETNKLPQHVCIEALDEKGNTSGVVCDNVMVKVDSNPIKIEATDQYNQIIEGSPHTVQGLFDIEFSVSNGNIYYFYYDNEDKYLLSNLADLPSGDITVEAIGKSGSGLISENNRVINVRKNIVTYDYKTNGGTSSSKTKSEVLYEGNADLKVTAERSGYEFVGWNTDKNADFALDSLEVNEDITLYAIFKKEINANFEIYNKQGNLPAAAEYENMTCTIYNNETECEIIIPTIQSKVGYEALGWAREKSNSAEYFGGEKINITNDIKFYSVTRYIVPNTASFIVIKNGEIEKETKKCYLYNGETSCKVDISDIKSEGLDGRPFKGITSDPDKVKPVNGEVELIRGENYYAYYEDEFTINFVSDEEHIETIKAGIVYIATEDEIVTKPDEITIPSPTSKDNYEIVGWRNDLKEEDATVHPGEKMTATSNVTYYAIYAKDITVKYESVSGTTNIPSPQKGRVYYNSGSKRTSNAVITIDSGLSITRPGYIFNGWTSDGKYYNQGTPVSLDSNKTFTAEWTDSATLVIFDYKTNGGSSVTTGSTTYRHGVTAPIDLTNVKANKSGYEFVGWSTNADAETSTMKEFIPNEGVSRVTLYAIFKRDLTIKYNNINSSVLTINGATTEKSVIYNNSKGHEITLPNVTSNKTNIEFLGWSTTLGATEVEYNAGDKVTVKESTTFYTVIRNNTEYVSTYVYYNGNNRVTKDVSCKLYNNDLKCKTAFNTENIKYNGAILTGWSSDPNNIVLADEQLISGPTTYYAVYSKQAIVKYNSGLNTDTIAPSTTSNIVGINYLVTSNNIKVIGKDVVLENPDGIAGFISLGWSLDKEATSATYYNRSILNVTDNVDLYAVYSKNVTLSYASLGGSPTPNIETKTVRYNTGIKNATNEASFTVGAAPIKSGVELDAWLLDNDESKRYKPGDPIYLTSSSKLYAKYKSKKYNITLNGTANGGKNPTNNVVSYVYDTMFDLQNYSASTDKNGYTFVGWSLEPNSKEIINEYKVPAENTTLYAVYKKTLQANWIMYDTNAGIANRPYTTCDIYNNETTCYAQVSNMTMNANYSGIGWSKTRGSTDINAGIGLSTPITQDTNFYSITRKTKDLVGTFYYYNNANVVSVSSSCTLYNGTSSCTVASPANPSNYLTSVFNAWSSSSNGYIAASLNISGDSNYYAYYKQITELNYNSGLLNNDVATTKSTEIYAIEYVANNSGGWSHIPNATLKTPAEINNFNTLGWREDNSLTTQTYNVGTQISMIKSHSLYAVYNRTITLSYNLQGGSPNRANQTATQYYNSGAGKTTHTFTIAGAVDKTGYTFQNWRLNGLSGTAYNVGSQINILEDTVMYAYFTPNTYYIEYYGNNNTGGSTEVTTCTYDSNCKIANNGYTKKGYSFNKWAQGSIYGVQIDEGSYVINLASENGAIVKMYADWHIKTYNVTINVINGTTNPNTIQIAYLSNNTINVTPNAGLYNSSGYYLSSVSCTNGYTATGFTTGSSATGSQTITINNSDNDDTSVCTVTFVSRNYNAYIYCDGGRTLSNGNCTYRYENNGDKCGTYQCNEHKQHPGGDPYTYTGTCTDNKSSSIDQSLGGCSLLDGRFGGRDNYACFCEITGRCTANWTETRECEKTGHKTCEHIVYDTCNNSCTLTENEYLRYSCSSGGSLSGTTCIF